MKFFRKHKKRKIAGIIILLIVLADWRYLRVDLVEILRGLCRGCVGRQSRSECKEG